MIEQGGYLPGIDARDVEWRELTFDERNDRLAIQVPLLTPAQMRRLTGTVADAREVHVTRASQKPRVPSRASLFCTVSLDSDRNW